jgi:hypothetical protein
MLIYPLTTQECQLIRWAQRVVPAVAVAVILFLGWISVAAAAG